VAVEEIIVADRRAEFSKHLIMFANDQIWKQNGA